MKGIDKVRKEREGKKREGSTEGNSHGRREKKRIYSTFLQDIFIHTG